MFHVLEFIILCLRVEVKEHRAKFPKLNNSLLFRLPGTVQYVHYLKNDTISPANQDSETSTPPQMHQSSNDNCYLPGLPVLRSPQRYHPPPCPKEENLWWHSSLRSPHHKNQQLHHHRLKTTPPPRPKNKSNMSNMLLISIKNTWNNALN